VFVPWKSYRSNSKNSHILWPSSPCCEHKSSRKPWKSNIMHTYSLALAKKKKNGELSNRIGVFSPIKRVLRNLNAVFTCFYFLYRPLVVQVTCNYFSLCNAAHLRVTAGKGLPVGSEPLKVSRTEMYSSSQRDAELNEGRQGRASCCCSIFNW
jgi:hypothetical protein